MSGIDQFLAEHYGTLDVAPSTEDVEKVAQAEMFLKLAAQHNVDINQLSDAQINQLWNQVWSEKTAEEAAAEEREKAKEEKAKEEHEKAKNEVKEGQAKFAEADYMGRIMAHSYVNQLREYAAAGELDFLKEAEGGKAHWARRGYEAAKKAITGGHFDEAKMYRQTAARAAASSAGGNEASKKLRDKAIAHLKGRARSETVKGVLRTGGIGAGAVGGVGAAGYGLHKALKKDDGESKESSALDEFAANYAIEKAASYGFDPEEAAERISAVLVLGPDPSDKIAYVEGLDDAVDVRSSELLELAGYPIDWSGTPFEKEAGEKMEKMRAGAKAVGEFIGKGAKGEGIGEAAEQVLKGFGRRGGMAPGETKKEHLKYWGKELGKRVGRTGAVYGGGAAAVGGTAAGVHHALKKKDDGDKEASVRFDVAAAELAVEKAAEAGWDPNQAIERINSLFNLGYEGDPEASEKVAYAQTGEQALNLRACELLELAGYTINW